MASIRTLVVAAKQKLRPYGDKVLLKKVVSHTEQTPSGIILPTTHVSENQVSFAKVVAVGTGHLLEDGRVLPPILKEGETVMVADYGGTRVMVGDEEFFLFKEEEVVGVLDE